MIKIYFDEDKDERIIDVAKSIKKFLLKNDCENLDIYLYEHEGSLWYSIKVNCNYLKFLKIEKLLDDEIGKICGDAYGDVGGDFWNVYKIKDGFDNKCPSFGLIFKEFKKPEVIIK